MGVVAFSTYTNELRRGRNRFRWVEYGIIVSIFVFFNTFAINQWLQYKRVGKWADYLHGERVYIILNFVAKSVLAWQIFANTLIPT